MINYIVVAIIVIVIGWGAYSAVKHFRGEGGCCGGSSYKPKRKRLSNVRYQKVFLVDGMHCLNCKIRVEEAVNDIPGVAGRVNLKKRALTVYYVEKVEDVIIKTKVESLGFSIIG